LLEDPGLDRPWSRTVQWSDLEADTSATDRDRFLARAGTAAVVGLTAGGLVAASVFARFLFLDLAGQRQFSTPLDVVLYYGAPAGLAILLFASLRLAPLRRLRFALCCMACALSVYGIELLLTSVEEGSEIKPLMALLANAPDKNAFAAGLSRQFGAKADIRTRDESIADLKDHGVDAVRIVSASPLFIDQPDGSLKSAINIDGKEVVPLGGVSNKVTVLCNEKGEWVDYRSDSRGFNNPDEIWQSTGLDIGAVGDSFSQGYCAPADQDSVALIRRYDAATMNLSIAGDGPLLMLATLSEYFPRFKPKIVLWFYYEGSDLADLQRERKSAVLTRYLEDDFRQTDLARQDDIDRALMAEIPGMAAREQLDARKRPLNKAVYRATAFAKLTAIRTRFNLIGETDARAIRMAADLETDNMNVFREVLSKARTRVAAWGGQLHFIYLPEWAHFTRYRTWGTIKHKDVLTIVSSLGIPVVDVEPAFRAQGDPLSLFPFRSVGHYIDAGHRLVADEVLRRLQSSSRLRGKREAGH
jgi:hypothetical protein